MSATEILQPLPVRSGPMPSASGLNEESIRRSVANPVSAAEKVNLLGMTPAELTQLFVDRGDKPFRAKQLLKWIYHRRESDFSAMTDLAKGVRAWLAESYEIRLPEVVTDKTAADGTRKWVLRMEGGNAVETIAIPDGHRITLCVSSQVGCVLDCTFCSTARQGFNRNLTRAEIVAQLWMANKLIGPTVRGDNPVTNVVMMGMGEPLANYAQVLPSLNLFTDDLGFGLSKRRVTLSTSGLVPYIDKLAADTDVALAISLHAPNDQLREKLVPLNRRYPIAELLAACRRYTDAKPQQIHVTYEYVMLDGVNDLPQHATQLAKLLVGMPAKVNLIPFNPFPGTDYQRSTDGAILRFQDILHRRGIRTTVRRTRGDDIDAACGQLVGKVQDRAKRQQRFERLKQRQNG